jgi:hypothetical protein
MLVMKKGRGQIAGGHFSKSEAVKKPSSITPEKERGLVKGLRKLEG